MRRMAADLELGAAGGACRAGGGRSAAGEGTRLGVLDALPAALSNLHGALFAAAARLEQLHDCVSDAKEAHLARLAAVSPAP